VQTLIRASSNAGELVVDPFVGSGTTAVVAGELGRRFVVGDADARYVGVARGRVDRQGRPTSTAS
jgi:site-specific DNA-methyltransferase (adenine-specific)